VDKINDLRLF